MSEGLAFYSLTESTQKPFQLNSSKNLTHLLSLLQPLLCKRNMRQTKPIGNEFF